MRVTIIQEEQRLDEIVFEHYGSLEHFDNVIDNNEHLTHKLVLDLGDEVELPEFKSEFANSIKAKTLWD